MPSNRSIASELKTGALASELKEKISTMSQEQIVIAGVIALNLVLLVLLITAYRLLAARTPTQHTRSAISAEADEIQGLEALFAHDSWPTDRFARGDQFSARAVDEFKG